MLVCIYAGERRDAAKFVWGDRGERVKVYRTMYEQHSKEKFENFLNGGGTYSSGIYLEHWRRRPEFTSGAEC